MAAARSVRRRRSAESANSRNTALRDVPRRVASASTSLRRSSGIDTITFAITPSIPWYTIDAQIMSPAVELAGTGMSAAASTLRPAAARDRRERAAACALSLAPLRSVLPGWSGARRCREGGVGVCSARISTVDRSSGGCGVENPFL
jgi:CRP-like cAMP-binding protein